MSDTLLPEFAKRFLASFDQTWKGATPQDDVRFVVLDCETTGLDPSKDRLVSIGAVAIQDGEIWLEDSFEALLRVEYNTSSVTVHGITRDEALAGMEEPEAVQAFLEYLNDGVIVGHHIGHDVSTFNAATLRHWGFELPNRFLDTMDLTLHLERDGAFAGREEIRNFSLDSLCNVLSVKPYDRHTAPGDAFITAQIFLKLLRLALRHGRTTLASLSERFESS